ncbi:MAG: hypothetical protein K0S56_534 [Microvirga sp.]|jgi:hypothetical protein|nr:hypothetical protein [Microvirga sp.]
MGIAPPVVDAMSLWQFFACTDGWKAAHGGTEGKEMSDADFAAASEAYDAFPDTTS